MQIEIPNEIAEQIFTALKRDDTVAAIKIYRDFTHCDLLVAKTAVENMRAVSTLLDQVRAQSTADATHPDANSGSDIDPGAQSDINPDIPRLKPGFRSRQTSISATRSGSGLALTINGVQVPGDVTAKLNAALELGNHAEATDLLHQACDVDLITAGDAIDLLERTRLPQTSKTGRGFRTQSMARAPKPETAPGPSGPPSPANPLPLAQSSVLETAPDNSKSWLLLLAAAALAGLIWWAFHHP